MSNVPCQCYECDCENSAPSDILVCDKCLEDCMWDYIAPDDESDDSGDESG